MPTTYRCTEAIAVNGVVTFTEGKLYQGKIYHEEGQRDVEEAGVAFRNDQNNLHLIPFDWLDRHFVQVPELDIMSHDQLQRWLTDGPSARQLYQAIITGREWLENFKPEMEDDDVMIEAVKERLEMIEVAYELTEESGMEAPVNLDSTVGEELDRRIRYRIDRFARLAAFPVIGVAASAGWIDQGLADSIESAYQLLEEYRGEQRGLYRIVRVEVIETVIEEDSR